MQLNMANLIGGTYSNIFNICNKLISDTIETVAFGRIFHSWKALGKKTDFKILKLRKKKKKTLRLSFDLYT